MPYVGWQYQALLWGLVWITIIMNIPHEASEYPTQTLGCGLTHDKANPAAQAGEALRC